MEISILVLTYNHGRFVRRALDSIVMQKINVPYEIIILDDASTDNTQEIIKEYKKKYPQKISLYLRRVNRNHPTKNGYFLLSKAKGKYYAFIEGDDYWTDEFKIQKQYDFLEQHPCYSGCMTDLIVVDENENEIPEIVYQKRVNNIYTLDDFRHLRGPGMTVSFMSRNYFNEKEYCIIYKASRVMGDISLYMLCLLKGDIYQMDDAMAAYRYICANGKGNFNSIHQENIYKNYMLTEYWIKLENFMRHYDKNFKFIPMGDTVKQISNQYSVRAILNLINESTQKRKYFLVYLAYKLFLDSNYTLEKKSIKNGLQYNWNKFLKGKKPIILFGAGAVASEYLDKYAWQNNILFLVDNDKNKQNTSFKGFLTKPPEEILKYKGKIRVLITNKLHENEIERQLQKMGIKNYYCYCSMQTNRFRNIVARRLLKISEKQ